MSKFITFVVVLVLSVTFIAFSQPYKLSGNVTDEYTGEVLIGANVYIKALSLGAVSNMNGKYEITNIPKGTYEITISFVGYLPQSTNLNFNADIVQNFSLKESPVLLQEVVSEKHPCDFKRDAGCVFRGKGRKIQILVETRIKRFPTSWKAKRYTQSLFPPPQGGGLGDANLVIRGFNQRNIGIMINGVPVNDMEKMDGFIGLIGLV